MSQPQIDPELSYLLDASPADAAVDASLLLRRPADPAAILARLGLSERADISTSYVERVGVLTVRAPAAVVRLLVAQPEVELASASSGDD